MVILAETDHGSQTRVPGKPAATVSDGSLPGFCSVRLPKAAGFFRRVFFLEVCRFMLEFHKRISCRGKYCLSVSCDSCSVRNFCVSLLAF